MSDEQVFRTGEVMFGTFYPKHYIVAVVADTDTADQARAALTDAGFATDDVRTFSGDSVLGHDAEINEKLNLFQRLARGMADEEQAAVREYLELAKQGCAFVTVYAPTEAEGRRALPVLARHHARACATTAIGSSSPSRLTISDDLPPTPP